jgi:phosphoglycerate dehydrogenase-like enzyme
VIEDGMLNETEGLITGAHLEMMKPYSTFINSSRRAIVRETEGNASAWGSPW